MTQPNVPWWVAGAVGVGIASCGFALVWNDPSFVLPGAAKFFIGISNAALGAFAVFLNIKKPT